MGINLSDIRLKPLLSKQVEEGKKVELEKEKQKKEKSKDAEKESGRKASKNTKK